MKTKKSKQADIVHSINTGFINTRIKGKFNKVFLALTLCAIPSTLMPSITLTPSLALESGFAALAAPKGDFFLEVDTNDHNSERKEVQQLLDNIESQWNAHNLEALMSNYADDYVNNDGLGKKAVNDLTKDFWEQYPDAKSASKTKEIRVDGSYATVDSRDIACGTTAKEIPGVNSKGELRSVSEGQLFLRKFANGWKIIGDRINFEKVKVAYGLARQIDASFTAPEQIKAGRKYAAKLEVKLPTGLVAVGEITTQNLQYPSPQSVFPNSPSTEVWKPLDTNALEKDSYILERIMEANTGNHNELLMTTIGITNAARNSLVGLEFLTRRMNVVSTTTDEQEGANEASIAKAKDVSANKENTAKDGSAKDSTSANAKKSTSENDDANAKSSKGGSAQPAHSGTTHSHKTPNKAKPTSKTPTTP